MSPLRQVPYDWASWKMDLVLDENVHAGTEALSNALERLSDGFADALARLSQSDCYVMINVVQEFDDDQGTTGLHISAAAMQWMARAQAALDIDQYVLVGRDE